MGYTTFPIYYYNEKIDSALHPLKKKSLRHTYDIYFSVSGDMCRSALSSEKDGLGPKANKSKTNRLIDFFNPLLK
ncbi:hypothetical protein A8L34_21060 [Bacillus sp. FJAT-27264]|nr:hypothetical protein A8L34_21060 [Bacillus sp. FJAT-27264]